MPIISVQSQVVTGHVGNSAAALALQLRGHEVWAVPTCILSHHPGHGGARGGPLPAAWFAELLAGMDFRACFPRCEALISGYLGGAAAADFVTNCLARVEDRAVFLCDPVLGDDGRRYVSDEAEAGIRRLAARAKILTPNAFELTLLSGRAVTSRADAVAAMRALGAEIVILTSFEGADTPGGALDILAVESEAAWRVTVPKIERKFSGAGDLFAALFLSFWLPSRNCQLALRQSCSLLQEVLIQTQKSGGDELALAETRHHIMHWDTPKLAEPLA